MAKYNFKKTLAGIFAVALVASAVPLAPFAPLLDSISITASADDYFYFDVNDDGTLTITDYNGTGGDVVIPSTIDGASVTSIGENAFYGWAELTSVTIPDSVKSIGAYAFTYCTELTSVTIPASVTSIGKYTFSWCTSLSEVTIPDSVTNIGECAFGQCESLSEVTIPDSVTNISESAFEECYSLTSVTIGNSVTSIGEWAFYSCGCLTEITIPDSVTSIGANAFEGCLELENVYYTGSESDWESVSIENGNDALKNATITYVKAAQKILNSELTYEIDEEGVLTITGDDTALPAFLDSEWNMTEWCGDRSKIKKVVFNTPNLTSIGRGAFYEFENLESIVLPNSLTMIGDSAFERCTSLEKIEFPNTLTTIGESAFYGCEKLESIELPDSLTTLRWGAFGFCKALKSIKLSAAMTSIPEGAFMYAAIESFTIPAGITEIGDFAFGGCPNLKAINVEADNSNYCSVDGVLFNKDKTALMQYPIGKEDAAYTVPDTVTSILEGAFCYAESLTDITLPDFLTTIEEDAFSGTKIKSITIPDTVTKIDSWAFGECEDLTSVIIPDSVTEIGSYAFEYCSSLADVTLSDSLKNIGECAFADCPLLTDITIPASVTNVGYGVFEGSGLKSATFECDDADAIANFNPDEGCYIFYGCTDLETIYVPVGCVDAYKNSEGYQAAMFDCIDLIQEMPTAEVKGYSVSYNGNVTINFHYAVSDEYKNGCLKFGDGTTISVNDAAVDGNGYYVFPISMPAKNMYDEITAQFCNGSGYAVGKTVTFKMSDYLSAVKEAAPNAACAEFVDNFLEYGAQAANYFNVSGAPTAKTYTDADYDAVITALAAYENVKIDDDTFVGATLLLKSTPKLRLYYSEPFTDSKQNELNPALFYIEKEIAPTKFGTEDLNDYLVYNYIYKAMNSNDESLKAICTALYNMSKAIPAVG